MRPEPVSAIVRDEMTIEVSSPTLGTHVLLIDELIEIMDKATEAVERFETPSRKVLDQTEKPMSKQTKNAVPTTKPALTYRGIIFQVMREATGPITIQEACHAAKPLVEQMGASGKTPMGSFKSKFYIAAKKGELVRTGGKFSLPAAAPAAAVAR
jgi:ribosomal protein S30